MENKKHQHQQSVKTLNLSGGDDIDILNEIAGIINTANPRQPYLGNALDRIQAQLDRRHAFTAPRSDGGE